MRPGAALSLALAAVGVQACFCPPTTSYTQDVGFVLAVQEDGWLLDERDGSLYDPDLSCDELCAELVDRDGRPGPTCTLTLADEEEPVAVLGCTVVRTTTCEGGRHHADLVSRARGRGSDAVGAWLSREAHGEAGSITAFRRLASELRAHGAPAALVAGARTAAGDEVRHARALSRLARGRGGVVERVAARPARPRTLRALALENAVEGCVHEMWAAAVAAYQAGTCADAEVRAVATSVAPDEVSHAELAWALHRWALSRLSPAEAREVEAARQQAWRRLVQRPPVAPPEVRAALGLPDAAVARRLAAGIAARSGVA